MRTRAPSRSRSRPPTRSSGSGSRRRNTRSRRPRPTSPPRPSRTARAPRTGPPRATSRRTARCRCRSTSGPPRNPAPQASRDRRRLSLPARLRGRGRRPALPAGRARRPPLLPAHGPGLRGDDLRATGPPRRRADRGPRVRPNAEEPDPRPRRQGRLARASSRSARRAGRSWPRPRSATPARIQPWRGRDGTTGRPLRPRRRRRPHRLPGVRDRALRHRLHLGQHHAARRDVGQRPGSRVVPAPGGPWPRGPARSTRDRAVRSLHARRGPAGRSPGRGSWGGHGCSRRDPTHPPGVGERGAPGLPVCRIAPRPCPGSRDLRHVVALGRPTPAGMADLSRVDGIPLRFARRLR